MATRSSLPYCSECGAVRVPHLLYKSQFVLDDLAGPLVAPTTGVGKALYRLLLRLHADRLIPKIARALSAIGFARIEVSYDPRSSTRTKALFQGAQSAGVSLQHVRLLGANQDCFFIAEKDGKLLVFSAMPRPRRFSSPSLDWMDDKGKLKEHLRRHGIPMAEGGAASTQKAALDLFALIGPPVIVKPHHGTGGRHTRIGIKTREDLLVAFRIAKQVSTRAIVERELSGIVHRVTLIGGRVSAVVRRDYPHVIGDGVATIAQLVERESADPRRDGFLFYKIAVNERAEAQLRAQGLDWNSVPKQGERVPLNDKVSRTQGTVTVDVTDELHPDNVALFERIADTLGDPLIGVDFIIGDMRRSWKEQEGCGVVECNSMPYIDVHHYPYEGKPRNVGAELWEYVFANHR